MNLNCT